MPMQEAKDEKSSTYLVSAPRAVVVERRAGGEAPCVLHLECRPGGAAEMVSVGILSEARNMEAYVGEEYCGTGRGQSLGAARTAGETDKVTLYKKYLKFECPAASCRIKLLSIGSSIDLDRVQTIMESMGSKLSPGAQQLMDMVRCQQKNSLSLEDKFNWIFGKNSDLGGDHAIDGLRSAAIQTSRDQSAAEPVPVKNHLTSETVYEHLKISHDLNSQVPEGGNTLDSERLAAQQNTVDLRNDFKVMGSLHMQEQGSKPPNVAVPQVLLPFLQNLGSQVNHLRLKDGDRHFGKNAVTEEEGIQCVG
ncbi:ATPase PAAT-like [Falco naumanni]|uniref:ATPase PAAT-like n=1 Tax=Falco naumanni TaxID=148594 RepID=UPI001ADE1336|nr:ATPase PAAT-like [Falco naumanni]